MEVKPGDKMILVLDKKVIVTKVLKIRDAEDEKEPCEPCEPCEQAKHSCEQEEGCCVIESETCHCTDRR